MSAGFTPGPWHTWIAGKTICILRNGDHHKPIVHWQGFDGCGLSLAKQEANARLIAAAPELYEALQVATHLLERYRKETPLGHQPHMIAHSAEAAVNVGTALLSRARNGGQP